MNGNSAPMIEAQPIRFTPLTLNWEPVTHGSMVQGQSFLVRVRMQYSQFSVAGVPVAESGRAGGLVVQATVPVGQCWVVPVRH